MRTFIIIVAVFMLSGIQLSFGQKLNKRSVPSLVINNFQKEHPRAYDVEWKLEKDIYKVDFETGIRRQDHTIWFDKNGKVLKQKSEISKKELPENILIQLNAQYKDYRVSDIKRIIDNSDVLYLMELKKMNEEWKISFSPDGVVLNKIPD